MGETPEEELIAVIDEHEQSRKGAHVIDGGQKDTVRAAHAARVSRKLVVRQLEPIHKVVESRESVVIPCLAPEPFLRGARCGSLIIAVPPTAAACGIRVI